MKPTIEQIREAQLHFFQDSILLTLDEARDKWLTMIPQWIVTGRELSMYRDQVQHSLLTAMRNIIVCDWQYQFYECGLDDDGIPRYRGMRYGLEIHQYQSGFGYF